MEGRGLRWLQVRETGWSPHHLVVREEGSEAVLGCCPIYMKVTISASSGCRG